MRALWCRGAGGGMCSDLVGDPEKPALTGELFAVSKDWSAPEERPLPVSISQAPQATASIQKVRKHS